jgi:selenocysteine lyase/cysteine desulfurase
MDTAAIRRAFPVLDEIIYLNTATMGIMPGPVADRYLALLRDFELHGLGAEAEARRWADDARNRLAAFLSVTSDEIALTGNATDGIAMVAAAISWQPGDEVLISDQEHPAMVFPFTHLAQQGRLTVRRFRAAPDPIDTLESVRSAIVPGKTRLVSFSHVTSQTGTRLPAAEIAAEAHAAGAWCFLDATQSFGQLQPATLNLNALDVDFATSNGHKWLGAGKGTGLLYVRRDVLDHLTPALVGAGAMRWPQAPGDTPVPSGARRLELVPSARRFEFGTRNWMLYASIPLAMDWLEAIGWDTIVERERHLATVFRDMLRELPSTRVLSPERWEHASAMVSFTIDGQDVVALAQQLWERHGIRCRTVPEMNAIRISTAYYNDERDLERFVEHLAG